MKKYFLFLAMTVLSLGTQAQNNDKLVDFDRIGTLSRGMAKAELEKLLNIKITLKHIGIDIRHTESINVKYMGADFELGLMKAHDNKIAFLDGITTRSPLFKTAAGIGVGSDKLQIINAYEKHLLIMGPWFEDEDEKQDGTMIKLVNINNLDDAIIFYMRKGKVVAVEVTVTPEFRDRE